MKLFSATPSSAPSAPAVRLAPGARFVARRYDLPAGMPVDEVAGFVELRLEEFAPFPPDQLNHGHVRAPDGSAVLVYAAQARSLATEGWDDALFVLPEFAPALKLRFNDPTVVLLRGPHGVTALRFEGGRELPTRLASRPLAPEATEEEIARVRETVAGLVGAGEGAVAAFRFDPAPQQRSAGLGFTLVREAGGGSPVEVLLPTDECWRMDVREAGFVARQRRRLGFDVVLWRCLLGAAATLALLLVGEILLGAGRGYSAWLAGKIRSRAPLAATLEDKDTVANRLTDFGRSGLQPFAMLASVWAPKPPSVYFTRTTAEGRTNLVIDANTQNVADVNAYEAALRTLPEVQTVEVRNVRPREDGTTFSVVVVFKPEVFARPTGADVAAAGGGG